MSVSLKRITRRSETRRRIPDREGTRQNIIEIATEEFAENGLAGARIDEIAARTKASKRMIYYYFEDKEGLYLSVLEAAYEKVRSVEAKLNLEHLRPLDALKWLVRFTFDQRHSNEGFVRLVMIENIHNGEYLARSKVIQALNASAIGAIKRLYDRGVRDGLFRKGIDPIDLHWQISALCFFNVSNRATFSKIFGRDLTSKRAVASLREKTIEMVVRYVLRPEKVDSAPAG